MLKVKTLARGFGRSPVKGQIVTLHWVGYGKDGDLSKIFWKQVGQRQPKVKIRSEWKQTSEPRKARL